jgi:hypothetical protein
MPKRRNDIAVEKAQRHHVEAARWRQRRGGDPTLERQRALYGVAQLKHLDLNAIQAAKTDHAEHAIGHRRRPPRVPVEGAAGNGMRRSG